MVYIYGLHTNLNDEIRYVGKCRDINQRLKMHYSQRNSSKTHKNNWINSIISIGGEYIEMKILEIVDESNWQVKEKQWIQKFDNLTNTSSGGLGGSGKIYNITYSECKKIVKNNKIISRSRWLEFTKEEKFPPNIPKNPRQYFKKDWVSWGDFLSTNRKQDNLIADDYIRYEDAKKWVANNLKIKSSTEWKENRNKIPYFIPNRPERFYKTKGWRGWPDFLKKERIANQNRKIIPYDKAKLLINKLNIKSLKEYKKIQSEMYINELPVHPHLTYKNKGFINYAELFKRLQ